SSSIPSASNWSGARRWISSRSWAAPPSASPIPTRSLGAVAAAVLASELPLLFERETHPAGMHQTGKPLEPAAGGRIAIPVHRGLGLASLVARHAFACCPGERQF